MTVGLGVLGAGRIGQVHARAVDSVAGAELVAIADPVAEAAQRMVDAHGGEVCTIDEIEGSGDIAAVLICAPTDTHADLIERFVRAGKAVFCEKPVDLRVDRVKRCLATVEAEGGTLMVGFQRLFDPDFRALKRAIDDGRLGDVEMVTLTSRDPEPPPYDYIVRSGGIFRDMTIHDFDVARWLLGEEVETVRAAASVLVDPRIGELGDFDSVNGHPDHRQRQAVHDHQLAPCHVWLRPANRGAWLQGVGGGREPSPGANRARKQRGLSPASPSRLLHDPLQPPPTPRKSPPSSRQSPRAVRHRPPVMTA